MNSIYEMKCSICGENHYVIANPSDIIDWAFNGKLIQDAMPYLSYVEREQLISQICPSCIDFMFSDEEE